MKKSSIKIIFFTVLFLLLTVGYANSITINQNDPMIATAGDYFLDYTNDPPKLPYSHVGEINVDLGSNGSIDFVSFCLEIDRYLTFGIEYLVDSVGNTAFGGGVAGQDGSGGDPLSWETKWVYYEYTFGDKFGQASFNANKLAAYVQEIIWHLEGETGGGFLTTEAGTFYNDYVSSNSIDYENIISLAGYKIQVLNPVFDITVRKDKQSLIFGTPVPEPATMLLFGTGLIGLAGLAHRRKKK